MCIEPFLVGWDHCSLHPFESPLFRVSFAARLPVAAAQVALANVEDKDNDSSCFVKGSGFVPPYPFVPVDMACLRSSSSFAAEPSCIVTPEKPAMLIVGHWG